MLVYVFWNRISNCGNVKRLIFRQRSSFDNYFDYIMTLSTNDTSLRMNWVEMKSSEGGSLESTLGKNLLDGRSSS